MPRQSKGPRLVFEQDQFDKDGKLRTAACWVIRDGPTRRRTGCGLEDREIAERKLGDYIASKYTVKRDGAKDPASIPIADVVNLYLQDKKDEIATIAKVAGRVVILLEWWGDKTLADVNGKTCRDYVKWRCAQPIRNAKSETARAKKTQPANVRRELEDLRAAINYHRKEGLCDRVVEVTLPERGKRREEFLTRSEAARLLWAAWTMREQQKARHDGEPSDDKRPTKKRTGKHIARFILVGLYTGTRHASICGASFEPGPDRSWIDLDKGVFHRLRQGRKETKKKQTPARLPDRLLNHLRRWKAKGISKEAVIEWNGRAIESVKYGFNRAVANAHLGKRVTPHTLRHTAATWLMDEGHKVWQAAGYLGMSPQVLEAVYAKHHPDYQIEMVGAFKSPAARKLPT